MDWLWLRLDLVNVISPRHSLSRSGIVGYFTCSFQLSSYSTFTLYNRRRLATLTALNCICGASIMLQDSSIGWDPMEGHHLQWQTRLFIVYSLVVSAYVLGRLAYTIWDIWRYPDGSRIREAFTTTIASMKRSAVLTFLLCLLATADEVRGICAELSVLKATRISAYMGSLSEAMTVLVLGIACCTAIYCLCDICEGPIVQRRLRAIDSKPRLPIG